MSVEESVELSEEYKPGVTNVSILAIVYAAVTMTPVIIFMSLSTGLVDPYRFIPVFVTLLLFTEIGRYTGRSVSTQEAFIMYFMAELVAFNSIYFQEPLLRLYYREAPYTSLFGIAELIPTWASPPLESLAAITRTFIAPEWAIPLGTWLASTLAYVLIDIALSFIFIQVYVEIERLEFPVAPIDAQAISTLTERTPEKLVVYSLAAAVSFMYEFALYGVPAVSETLVGTRITVLPYPWIDLTGIVERGLPGAMLGISTDISTFAVGWVIPFQAALWILIGSLSMFMFGNTISLAIKHPYFEAWQGEWVPGQPIEWIWQRSVYNLWASPQIGLILALGISTVILSGKAIIKAVRNLSVRKMGAEGGYLELKWIMLILAVGTLIGIAVDIALYPRLWFVWIIIWTAVPFIQGAILARSYGEVGLGVRIPYIKQAFMLTFTRAGDPAPWLVPTRALVSQAGIIVHRIKVAKLTKTRPLDYFKSTAITLPIIIAISFVYWQIFWAMAPVPSSFYPWSAAQWPIRSLTFSLWVSRSIEIFKADVILYWLSIFLVVGLVARRFKIPFSFIGFVAGAASGGGTLPPFALNYFLGAVLSKLVERHMGKEKWEMYRPVALAGLFTGLALAIAVSVAITMITRSLWATPF